MRRARSNRNQTPIIFKTAGGVALQTVALLNAIEISITLGRPFKIRHYPHGTGGYYPFGIRSLILASEIDSLDTPIKGSDQYESVLPGDLVKTHPIFSDSFFNYEKLLEFLRRIRVDSFLRRLRGEWVLTGTEANLKRIPQNIRFVSGSYMPIFSKQALEALKQRFQNSEFINIFSSQIIDPELVVVHIRLGNKRTAFSHPAMGAVHSIIDPLSIKQLLISQKINTLKIGVISDEPLLAKEVLESVGITGVQHYESKSIWSDLAIVSQASYFVGTWSTVSMLALACFADDNRKIFFPRSSPDRKPTPWKNSAVQFYPATYLGPESEIYMGGYSSNINTHSTDYQNGK